MGHSERAHARLSASGAYRWMACPPSVLLEQQFPDAESEAAKEGTLAHELAEAKLRKYFYPASSGKDELVAVRRRLKKDPLWNKEMEDYTEEYLDYIKAAALSLSRAPYVAIEAKVYFSEYTLADSGDKNDGFGTADCILISGSTLWVIDFKYGKSPEGRVSAEQNPQMMLYALGAYQAYRMLYPFDTIRMTIVQPRLSDGISEWSCTVPELLGFGERVKGRAKLALEGAGEFHPDEKTCRFCKARGRCRARAEENVRLAFAVEKKPPLISNEEMGQYLKQGTDVAKWLSDLQDCALAECLAGYEVPGWKAVEGRGSREWTDLDQAFDVLTDSGIAGEILWERKPLSLAQIEKAIGKKTFADLVGEYVVKKPGKPALVPEADKRPAITNRMSAAEAFAKKEDA